MISIKEMETHGWEPAVRGMRNPMNSRNKSDSYWGTVKPYFFIGEEDLKLMKRLVRAGSSHRKFMRMIVIYMDITAPLYWWKEFDTYKVATVGNSCSTMHKIHSREFRLNDFSMEHLVGKSIDAMQFVIDVLNMERERYLESNDKERWWQMIQLLPSSYNQRRTEMINYEVARKMYQERKNHKLDEWRELCAKLETLPYSELITSTFEG